MLRSNRRSFVAVLAVLCVAACGGGDDAGDGDQGPDVGGWYEVTHHTLGDGDCLAEGGDATGLAYIRLTPEDHSGTPYFALWRCDDMDPAACD